MRIIFSKKIYFFCTLLLILFMAAGCEKAPDPKKLSDTEDEIQLTSAKYVSIEEAEDQIQTLEGKDIDGIYFPEHFEMPDITAISQIKLTAWYPEHEKDLETAIRKLWKDYDNVDWTAIKEKKFSGEKDESYYVSEKQDEKTGLLYSYDSNGFFCGDSLNDTELTCESCVREYDFEWGDTASVEDVYPLVDGETVVLDAVAYTEKLFNETLSQLERTQFTYKVQHLYVVKHSDEDYYDYNMVIGRVYKGISIDTSSDFNLMQGKSYKKIHCGAHFMAVMRHKNSLDFVNTCNELFEIDSITEKDTIISPIWAVQQMNQEIAHAEGIRFSDCGLVYVLTQDNKLAEDNVQDVYQQVDESTYLRPVWLFTTDNSGMVFNTMTKDSHGVSVLVDALDGTLYYYENTGAY